LKGIKYTKNPKILAQEALINDQRQLLEDFIRLEAYRKAIYSRVSEDSIVVDLGCGSGILSFFAYQAGAKKIYAIENSDYIIQLAEKVAEFNSFNHKIKFINKHSNMITKDMINEEIDILITETLGTWALEENILTNIIDFRDKFLKKGGTIIPNQINLYLVPYESSKLHKKDIVLGEKLKDKFKIDFDQYLIPNNAIGYVLDNSDFKITRNNFLIAPIKFADIDLEKTTENQINKSFKIDMINIGNDRLLHGFCGYFDAILSHKTDHTISLSNSPIEHDTNFSQVYFPIQKPIRIKSNNIINIQIEFTPPSNWVLKYEVE
jgi:2-polyprenyl-3-methyl-5-hydroxy-6-metoxy-1,4-benzoquinol methylase